MDKIKNDVFFVCTIIEYLGRYTFNHRGDIVRMLGIERIKHQLDYADVNHCLDIEQVAVELIEEMRVLPTAALILSVSAYTRFPRSQQ